MDERKYFVKAAFRTNLDSMITKLQCFEDDMQDGKRDTVKVMGVTYDIFTIGDFIEECRELLYAAEGGKVTGKQYGRIKAISDTRDAMRYSACVANGMSESKAANAFLG